MAVPHVTSIYAALLALLLVALSTRVILYRRAHRIGLGDAGDRDLQRRVRAQGNLAEYAPLGLVLLLLLEADGTGRVVLHALGLMLLLGRLAHAAAFSGLGSGLGPRLPLRTAGTALTLTMLILAALALLARGLT